MSETAEKLLTVREVADRLRLSAASIYEMVKSGRLVARRLGPRRGAIRIREGDLEDCLAVSESKPATAKPARMSPRVKLKHIRL